MNTPLLIANILAFIAFFVHTFQGDKELHELAPSPDNPGAKKLIGRWIMARAGWHVLSLDLLWVSLGMALINFTDLLPEEAFLLKVLGIYILGTGVVWLFTVLISPAMKKKLLYLGQWMLLGTIGGLVMWAAYTIA